MPMDWKEKEDRSTSLKASVLRNGSYVDQQQATYHHILPLYYQIYIYNMVSLSTMATYEYDNLESLFNYP